jgi:hypothetical protein
MGPLMDACHWFWFKNGFSIPDWLLNHSFAENALLRLNQ